MGKEIKAEQRDTTSSTIMFSCALAVCRSFKPEASLLNILQRPVAKGHGEHPLRTDPRRLLMLHNST